jgi:hypothetical protein
MIAPLLLLAGALIQAAPIGSGLSAGTRLVYESGGTAQAPWIYDTVRVTERSGFARCVVVTRRSQPPRESCVRNDTLFEAGGAAELRPARPIGPGMSLETRTVSGNVLMFATSNRATRPVGALAVEYVETTIVTHDSTGRLIRRLLEHYAPALLTAIRGVFEEPDASGNWTLVREFTLRTVIP